MSKKPIIEYEGEIPPARLEGKIGKDDFYTPEEIRAIILDAFPIKGKKGFDGLWYIAIDPNYGHGDIDLPRYKVDFKALQGQCNTREEILEKIIPDYEEHSIDLDIEINESITYKKKKIISSFPYEFYISRIILTNLGYVFENNRLARSNRTLSI